MGIELKGLEKTIERFDKLQTKMGVAAGNTVKDSTEKLMEESQIQVPKATGALAGTATYVALRSSGYNRSRAVKYGNSNTDSDEEGVVAYAAAVHEILKASHDSPTKAKYVEDPLVQGVPDYKEFGIKRTEEQIKEVFK